ncbi:MAG TPA: SRPBCC family protein [Roseiflexaceae bacterium]|nr:SRPBCC family protein [Roseiflexaceae bacterium]
MAQPTFTIDRDKREMVMTRVFDAPRELVFKTYIDPKLLPQWWGMGGTTTVDKMDVRPGGQWRYVQHDESGNQFAFSGVYQEVVPPERLTYTFEFEAMPGHVMVETILFEEQDGKTNLTSIAVFETLADLEGMLQSGAEHGATITWNRLAELVGSLQSQQRH